MTTVKRYPLIIQGLPYLINRPGTGHKVKGELYNLPIENSIARLDRLEGHPHFYQRIPMEVEDGAGNRVIAQTYFINHSNPILGEDGHKMWTEYAVYDPKAELLKKINQVR